MFHTIYLSFEEDGRDYIGKHSTNNPYDGYLGSFKDDTFDPTNKIILEYATTEEGAIKAEMRWQRVFNVVEELQFANLSYQTSTAFVTGFKGENHPMYGRKRPDTTERNLRDNPSKRPEVAAKIAESARKRKGTDTEETRQKKGKALRDRVEKDSDHQSKQGKKAASLKFMDPDHPELGVHNAGNLTQIQRKFGYPSSPGNRKKWTG